jgi:hypothetical protein
VGLTVAIDPRDPLAQWWVHTTDVQRFTGAGPDGDTWDATDTALPCFISDKRRLVRASTGEQVVSETTVLYPKSTPDIPIDSLVTLPALFGGRTSNVLSVSRHDGGGLPTPDHLEVALA